MKGKGKRGRPPGAFAKKFVKGARRQLAQQKCSATANGVAESQKSRKHTKREVLTHFEATARHNEIIERQNRRGARQHAEEQAKLDQRLSIVASATSKKPRLVFQVHSQSESQSLAANEAQNSVVEDAASMLPSRSLRTGDPEKSLQEANTITDILLKEIIEVAVNTRGRFRQRMTLDIGEDALSFLSACGLCRARGVPLGAHASTAALRVPKSMSLVNTSALMDPQCVQERPALTLKGLRTERDATPEDDGSWLAFVSSADKRPQKLPNQFFQSEEELDRFLDHVQKLHCLTYTSEPLFRTSSDLRLLSFLARMLGQQVRECIATGPPSQLRCILRRLEELDVIAAAEGCQADLYLGHCLESTLKLCISPSLGNNTGGTSGSCYGSVRKYAAILLSQMVMRHRKEFPHLAKEVCEAHLQAISFSALQTSPAIGPMSGAVWGLCCLGVECIEGRLLPLLRDHRIEARLALSTGPNIAAPADSANFAAALRRAADLMLVDALRACTSSAVRSKLSIASYFARQAARVAGSDPTSMLSCLSVPRGFTQGPAYGGRSVDPLAFCL